MSEIYFDGEDTEKMASNLLEKGRYEVETIDINQSVSQNGNKYYKAVLQTKEGVRITDFLLCEGAMKWKWSQYLYAVGIRQKGQFQVAKSRLVGAKCLADVGVKTRTLDDGSIIKENKVNSYSPIEQATAPIKGVEPEEPTETETTTKTDATPPAETDDDL